MSDKLMNEKNYFELRNIKSDFYRDYRLPRYLVDVLPKNMSASILDIGCGLGQFLSSVKEKGYTDLKGVDVSEEAIKSCTKLGITVEKIHDIIEYSMTSKDKYDFIMMGHVLEHLDKSQIINTLHHIRHRLMNENAIIVIMVPNAQSNTDCYWAYEDFTHTTLFTAGSLCYVLKAAGFNDIKFLDADGLEGAHLLLRPFRAILLQLYKWNLQFWNQVTGSSFHERSPQIFTYELKVLAR